jgi:DNA-binding NarL/FixJ family response regulator
MKYDVLIVEDEAIIAETLKTMLESMGHNCVGIEHSFLEAAKAIERLNCDLVILDINLEGDHEGIKLGELCNELNKPFMFLTSYSDSETVLMARNAKPGAYLIKPFTQQQVFASIEISMVNQAKNQIGVSSLKSIISQLSLSDREAEVLSCLCERLNNTAIAQKLHVSTNTVKFHLKNIYTKLNINGRSDLDDCLNKIASDSKLVL